MPPGSVVQGEDDEDDSASDGSQQSLSLLDDDLSLAEYSSSSSDLSYLTISDDAFPVRIPPTPDVVDEKYMHQWSREIEAHRHRSEVENLQSRQYWRSEWRMDPEVLQKPFNVGNASTLGGISNPND